MSVSRKMQTASRHLASLFVCPSLIAVAYFSLFTLLLTLTTACEREPLELYYDGKADMKITYDWISKYGERPEGMTFMLAHNSDTIRMYDVTHNVDETSLRLNSGQYLLTVINKTFGEYSKNRVLFFKSDFAGFAVH